jgi:hypothetical protein
MIFLIQKNFSRSGIDKIITNLPNMKSPVFQNDISRTIVGETSITLLIKSKQANYYNSYLTQWYLFKTKEKYQIH